MQFEKRRRPNAEGLEGMQSPSRPQVAGPRPAASRTVSRAHPTRTTPCSPRHPPPALRARRQRAPASRMVRVDGGDNQLAFTKGCKVTKKRLTD
eukprot:scaffold81639_cov63-Phaeocystis_antarctica.AAC.4